MAAVVAVHRNESHAFSKTTVDEITLVAGLGVDGDAHRGATVKHRSRLRGDRHRPNLRQVHLLHVELFDELAAAGFRVGPGDLGENVTTRAVELLELPVGTVLRIGAARIELTGVRNPCRQIDDFQPGLLAAVRLRDGDGSVIRKTGVMGVVTAGGVVRADDAVGVDLPTGPHRRLEPV